MKLLIALFLMCSSFAIAGTPTPTAIDTVKDSNGNIRHFICSWYITCQNNVTDTCKSPFFGSTAEVVLDGAGSSDTLMATISSGACTPHFSERGHGNNAVIYRSWQSASSPMSIDRVY